MRTTLFVLAAALVVVSTASVRGHHAFGAEFDPNAPIKLQGKVVDTALKDLKKRAEA